MHRFAIGQRVFVPWAGQAAQVPSGTYVVVRLLPSVNGEPHYRVKSTSDGRHRALLESQMRPLPPEPAGEQASDAAEAKSKRIAVSETQGAPPSDGKAQTSRSPARAAAAKSREAAKKTPTRV